jgi:hypothetical protein
MKNLQSQFATRCVSLKSKSFHQSFQPSFTKFRGLALASTLLLTTSWCANFAAAQETVSSSASSELPAVTPTSVPRLVRFSGTAKDVDGKPLNGTVGITFLLYSASQGGAPLFLESQNVQADASGRYSVQLGATKPDGLPTDLFNSGEARWLGIQISGQSEQARVVLVSVPYALKAGDAETVGGLPPSAFILANGAQASVANNKGPQPAANGATKNGLPPANPAVTGKGVVNYIPMWDTTSDIVDSIIFQKTSEIGINTTTPAATLDVNGKTDIRDTLTLFPKTTDSTLAVSGTSFKVDSTGKVTFISGQTFPGAGTITGVTTASGSGLSGGGTTGTLSLKVPSAGITNPMLANSKITLNASTAGGVTAPGAMTLGSTYTVGLKTCSTNQILQYNGTSWACATLGTGSGTVTSVASGSGLTGGPITTSGTLSIASAGVTNTMLQHNSLTVTAGAGLTGGGSVALGASTTLNLNTAVVPELTSANMFTGVQTFNAGALAGNTIQAADGTFPFLTNSVTCCNSGNRMIWAQSPAFSNWGIYYDDNLDRMHWRQASGAEFITADFVNLAVGINNVNPAQALDVAGSIQASSSVLAGGDVDANGNINGALDVNGNRGIFGTQFTGAQALYASNNGTFQALQVTNFASPIGGFTEAQFDTNGNATFYTDDFGNTTAKGTKSAAVPLASGAMVKVFSTESPEVWFEDYGFGQLSGGAGTVIIDSAFAETVSLHGYHVFVTPKGDCHGLYITNETDNSFEVRELGGGQSSVEFDYRVVAHRKGYETTRLPAAAMPSPQFAAKVIPPSGVKVRPVLALDPMLERVNPQSLYRQPIPPQGAAPAKTPRK